MKASAKFRFRLYVAGSSPNSALALQNLRALCAERLPQRHEIEVVDVLAAPERALDDGILVTPTLVKLAPAPQRRVIGSLAQRDAVLLDLGLPSPLKA